MSAEKFFTYAAELLKLNPPHLTDEPIVAQLTKIGIEPEKASISTGSTPPSARRWKPRRKMGGSEWPGKSRPWRASSTAGP